MIERRVADGHDWVGDGDAGEAVTATERILADGGDGIGGTINDHSGRNDDSPTVFVVLRIRRPSIGDFGFVAGDSVVDAADLIGVGSGW